ncbi:MAG TPA: PAS domain S-box protein [Burkholderiaceae bacterium]|nr:PAS domain S-box protein [Burkholderiaceae bacterium]
MRDALFTVPSGPPAEGDRDLYRILFENYPDALIVSDAQGTIVQANPAAARLLRYEPEALIGLPIDTLVPDAERPRHAAHREAYGRDPKPRPMGTQRLAARRADGTSVEVEIELSPLRSGGRALVVAAVRDVSEYVRVQQAVRRSRYSEFVAQLGRAAVDARDPQVLFERLPSLCAEALHVDVVRVFLLEPGRLEFRVAAGIGAVPGEAVGTRIPNRPDTPAGYVIQQAQPVIVEKYANERRFAVPQSYLDLGLTSALAVPLSDRGRPIGALTVRAREAKRFGLDEQRFLESLANLLAASLQRADSEEALNHAQRLESVGQLTGGIAHDFNNLLTVIQGNLQMLQELPRLADDEQGQQLVSAAARAAHRGAELTGKLLAFSRRQVLQPSSVDVGQLCTSLADMLRRTLDQRIVIGVETADRCPPVLADMGQLESALLNIAINARDAMSEGGTLRFIAAASAELSPAVRSELQAGHCKEGYVAIAVSDSGAGMSDEVRERAFEPFFTTKPPGRGTGLGLSTVYGFVKQSNGAITIDSALGHGTTVTLYLPRVRLPARRVGDDEVAGAAALDGLRVLMVEDEPSVAAVAQGFLERARCRVTGVGNGEQALRLLESDAEFDLLLTDVALGAGMSGTALAQAAQDSRPGMPVLLMSGYATDWPGASAAQSWELLRKPFTREQLLAAVARATAP